MAFIVLEHLLGQAGSYMKAINIYHKSNKAFMATKRALLEMPFIRPPEGDEEMKKSFNFLFLFFLFIRLVILSGRLLKINWLLPKTLTIQCDMTSHTCRKIATTKVLLMPKFLSSIQNAAGKVLPLCLLASVLYGTCCMETVAYATCSRQRNLLKSQIWSVWCVLLFWAVNCLRKWRINVVNAPA